MVPLLPGERMQTNDRVQDDDLGSSGHRSDATKAARRVRTGPRP